MLFDKLNIKNEEELFGILNLDLLVATAGKKGARFTFKENNKIQIVAKQPKIIEDITDDTGAGDSFFSMVIKEYAYSNKIDRTFIDKCFEVASNKSAEVIQTMGSRLKK